MHVLYAWLSCRPSDAAPSTWVMPQKHPRGQLWQRLHGVYALANNNKPPKYAVISSDLFSRTQKSFFGVFIHLKIEDAKLRQTALGCYLIWSREWYKCLFTTSCRLALTNSHNFDVYMIHLPTWVVQKIIRLGLYSKTTHCTATSLIPK